VQNGAFEKEIVPVVVSSKKESITIKEDEEVKKYDPGKMVTLLPAFKKETGTITAANASKINDGAAAVVLSSASKLHDLKISPLAKIISNGLFHRFDLDKV
jgi:acetyl-CoA C-acetyltransferase